MSSVAGLSTLVPLVNNIVVSVSEDAKVLSVTCPNYDCEIVDIVRARQLDRRQLPQGDTFQLELPIRLPAEQFSIAPAQ